VAGVAIEDVVAVAAVELVVTIATVERVVAPVAVDLVVAVKPANDVVTRGATKRVVIGRPGQRAFIRPLLDAVVGEAADHSGGSVGVQGEDPVAFLPVSGRQQVGLLIVTVAGRCHSYPNADSSGETYRGTSVKRQSKLCVRPCRITRLMSLVHRSTPMPEAIDPIRQTVS
jgi:hypothetical protein